MLVIIRKTDAAFANQSNQFCANIDKFATILGLDTEKVNAYKIANTYLQFIFSMQLEVQAYAHTFSNYKKHLHFGPSMELMGATPKAPVYPTVQVPISKGNVRTMLANMAQNCIISDNFTEDMGIALGFMDAVTSEKDEAVITPVLTAKLTTGGHPIIHAAKGIYQGYEVWKDSNDTKGFLKLDTSLYPDFTDNSPLPAYGKGASWKYKIIYLLKGVQCGNWSNEVNIGVYGEI